MNKKIRIIAIAVTILAVGTTFFLTRKNRQETTNTPTPTPTQSLEASETPLPTPTAASTKTVRVTSIPGAHSAFTFEAKIPTAWEAESIAGSNAINFYDPHAEGATNLEKSQVFIRSFEANSFLTLSTVTIHNRTETTVNNRPAVRYDIEKKSGVANFTNQPAWRNQRHIVTDVRVSDTTPSVFYVIAQRPDLSNQIYDQFLADFRVTAQTTSLIEPIAEFKSRITKKPFGIFITPQNSPVQPEKFSGYHTGVDVEYADVSADVPVKAIADGVVERSSTISGYGGVVVMRHTIDGQDRLALYGHLEPQSMVKNNTRVQAGETIGRLGDDKSSETDGERKHLHFAILQGTTVDLRGYVTNQSELTKWLDPLSLFK